MEKEIGMIALHRKTQKAYRQDNNIKKTRRAPNPVRNEFRKKMKRCKYCKSTFNLTVDHKIPLIIGGKDEPSNWQCLCETCNRAKSSLTDGQVEFLFKWFLSVQESRIKHGKKPYILK